MRQLRLRDIGGIIVIDFIDMASPKNRAAVEEALGEELERDRTKTYVVEISPLGLVEMTRQNVTDGPREVMTKKCPTCGGDGIVISEHTAAVDIERRLRSLVTPGSRDKAFKVEVAAKVAWLVVGPGAARLRELEETTKRRFFLVGAGGRPPRPLQGARPGHAREGSAEAPGRDRRTDRSEARRGRAARPARGHRQASRTSTSLSVGAASLVGKKVTATVTAVTEGLAWAELVAPAEIGDEPLTAEAEAEKPTRAKRSSARKPSEAADAPRPTPSLQSSRRWPRPTSSRQTRPKATNRPRRRCREECGGRRRRTRASGPEEAHPAWLAWRQEPQEAPGSRRR